MSQRPQSFIVSTSLRDGAIGGFIVHNAPANGIAYHGQGASRQGRTQVGGNSRR
jgi:hypothetical protein